MLYIYKTLLAKVSCTINHRFIKHRRKLKPNERTSKQTAAKQKPRTKARRPAGLEAPHHEYRHTRASARSPETRVDERLLICPMLLLRPMSILWSTGSLLMRPLTHTHIHTITHKHTPQTNSHKKHNRTHSHTISNSHNREYANTASTTQQMHTHRRGIP